jgi:hypothetical protein
MLQAVELPSSITHLNTCNAAAVAATEKKNLKLKILETEQKKLAS